MVVGAPLIGIEDLPMQSIYLRLDSEYLHKLSIELNEIYGSKRKAAISLGINWTTFRDWFTQRYFMPLWFAIKCHEELNIPIDMLEKNIIEYKGDGTSHLIKRPILPIKKNPELFNIVGHFVGDGFITSKNVGYVNINEGLLKLMEVRIKNTFGEMKILYSNSLVGVPTIIFPRVIGKIIKHIFDMDFRCRKTRIPEIIFSSTKEEKSAFIRALFDDDGSIRMSRNEITLYSANYYLLKDVQKLLSDLNIKSNVRQMSKKREYYVLYVIADSVFAFSKIIGFEHKEKKVKLERLVAKRFKQCKLTI